jgi:undecaprenyl-diphosphatase
MRETPRSQETAGEPKAELPQRRFGRAFAHTTGASGSGTPHGSDGRPSQTPRGARHTGPVGRLGTTPPVPSRPTFPFPALLALCATLAILFSLITWQVAADGPLRALDERTGRAVVGDGPRAFTELLADLGNMAVALPVLAAALAYAVWRGRRRDALAAALAMALVPALVAPLQGIVDRVGPLTAETGYYPSGHAATAMVAYCGAALLVSVRLVPVAALLTVATGVGLVLRGYHWPLDVLGSWCLCGLLLLLLPPLIPARR